MSSNFSQVCFKFVLPVNLRPKPFSPSRQSVSLSISILIMYIFPVILSLNLSPIFITAPSSFHDPPGGYNGLIPKLVHEIRTYPYCLFFRISEVELNNSSAMRTLDKLLGFQTNHIQLEFLLTMRTQGVKIEHRFPFFTLLEIMPRLRGRSHSGAAKARPSATGLHFKIPAGFNGPFGFES